jgi:hypothetical protein
MRGGDRASILRALDAARIFQPLDPSQVVALLGKTAKAAEAGQFELYKTTHHSTAPTPTPVARLELNDFQISSEKGQHAGIHQH